MAEIGSEFHIDNRILSTQSKEMDWEKLGFQGEVELVLSGRTAIDRICQVISAKKVCLPAYCCESMIEPFRERGFDLCFYDLNSTLIGIDFDVLFVVNYFGFSASVSTEIIRKAKQKGSIIIYDRTHSLFGANDPVIQLADYSLCSLRKWMELPAGAVVSKVNSRNLRQCGYAALKYEGMLLKNNWLRGMEQNKQLYFEKFSQFAHHLSVDYKDYAIDTQSESILKCIDFDEVERRRKGNAKILYEGLSDICALRFMWQYSADITPLFVPIFVKNGRRDDLRNFLIDNKVYLPVHWPKPSLVSSMQEVYDNELSLVCDQRYTEEDMSYVVNLVRLFYKINKI